MTDCSSGASPSAAEREARDEPERSKRGVLWHGRFESGPSEELMAYTESLSFDRAMWRDDIVGSRAHVTMLAEVGILTTAERDSVIAALDRVEFEMGGDTFEYVASDEDIHTAVERRVTELAGDAGAKLHTGRSRNDQSATDVRLWMKRELREVATRLVELEQVLFDRAEAAGDIYLPGYTHLQRAQPVLLAHHLLAHAWAFSRDLDRLRATLARHDVSPLGAGALAGSSLPLDPTRSAELLGFNRPFENSLDAVGSRDHIAEALFDLTMIGLNLSRLGEEWVLWTTEEFGFAKLHDSYSTGSSMLPQKKNPDIAELARGKAGRLIGNLTGLLATMKSLPLSYNRDLQEDKEPLFDSVRQIQLALTAISGMIATATLVPERMKAAADAPASSATDLAEWLVQRGMPFRQAHAVVGTVVRASLEPAAPPLAILVTQHPDLGPDAAALVRPGVSVTRRITRGGAGPVPVAAQMERFRSQLAADRSGL
jgi:argininosuccinate lyase